MDSARDRIIVWIVQLPLAIALLVSSAEALFGLLPENLERGRLLMLIFAFVLVFVGVIWLVSRPVYGIHIQSVIVILLTVFWVLKWDVPKHIILSLFLLIAYSLIYYLDLILGRQSKYKYWIGLILVIVIIAFFLPDSPYPMEWKLVRKFIAKVEQLATDISWQIDYAIGGLSGKKTSAGYSDIGLISGGLGDSDRDEAYFSDTGDAWMIYLKGCSKTDMGKEGFTGDEDPMSIYDTQLAVYFNALYYSDLTPREIRCFTRIDSSQVTYAYIRTDDVLTATNTFWFDKNDAMAKGGSKGFSYRLHYLNVDYASPYFIKMISERQGISFASYEDLSEFIKEVFNLDLSKIMSAEEYLSAITVVPDYYGERYLDTSMSTDRIRDLTYSITAGMDSDYTRARAIESFLRQYKYDKSVDLTGSENYIEDFLFKTQRGYCVHYASSMVLMLRLCGIPAKYTLGYYHKDNADHVVKSNEAHAWVQAYIDGIGWMDFEPTGSKKDSSQLRWSPILPEDADSSLCENGEENNPSANIMIPDAEVEEEAEEPKELIPASVRRYLVIFFAIALLLTLVVVGGKKLRYLLMDERGKVIFDMAKVRAKLEKRFDARPESIYDFLPLMDDNEERTRMKEIFDTYYRIRFRGDEADPEFRRRLHKMK